MTSTIGQASYQQSEAYQIRLKKLEELRQLGIEPYPHCYVPTHQASKVCGEYAEEPLGSSEEGAEGSTPEAMIAGRLVLMRPMGKNIFAQLEDGTGRLQVMFNKEHSKVTGYERAGEQAPSHLKIIEKRLDLGDIIGVQGHLFRTQKGEITLFAKEVTLLCKTLLPLADKHSGLADKETRYRKRWLDLISNPEIRNDFRTRSRVIRIIRETLHALDFTEVETPVLQSIYGGAAATPFTTRLKALDQEMFLRVSLEIPLKKLIVGGMDRVFEMGRVFRNESIDRNHNPEFTLLEAYAAYWDYNDMMRFMEELFEKVAIALFGDTKIQVSEELTLDLKAPWQRLTMYEALKTLGGIDVEAVSDDELRERLAKLDHHKMADLSKTPRGKLIATAFEEFAEDKLIQPTHIIDHPTETTPLCKGHRNGDASLVERFETYMLGQEMSNAYSELNDPVRQRELLEDQAAQLAAGDEEANPLDEEFLEAICQGMPPTGGIGIGIDRMIMLFTNAHSIRDVLLFPWMK